MSPSAHADRGRWTDVRVAGSEGGVPTTRPTRVRGGRSAPRGRTRKGPRPLDNSPAPAAGRRRAGPKGAGPFRSSARGDRAGPADVGPVFSRSAPPDLCGPRGGRRPRPAFEPVAAPVLIPFARRRVRARHPRAAACAAAGWPASPSALAFYFVLIFWMRSVGPGRLDRARRSGDASSTPSWAPSSPVLQRHRLVAAVDRGRLGERPRSGAAAGRSAGCRGAGWPSPSSTPRSPTRCPGSARSGSASCSPSAAPCWPGRSSSAVGPGWSPAGRWSPWWRRPWCCPVAFPWQSDTGAGDHRRRGPGRRARQRATTSSTTSARSPRTTST